MEPAILSEFPKEKRAGRPPEYPWDVWMDGETRRLIRGEHFTCTPLSLRSLIHLTARKRGLNAKTQIETVMVDDKPVETMIVLFYKKDE